MEHQKEIEVRPLDPNDPSTWVTDKPTSAEVRRRMVKPSKLRIWPPGDNDQDVVERVVRGLQDSFLHVFVLGSLAPDPEQPEREDISIMLELVAVTDGTRGFLVLTDDYAAPNSDRELLDHIEDIYEGGDGGNTFATRVGRFYDGPYRTKRSKGALDFRNASTVRRVVEKEYAKAFEGKEAIDHGVFVRSFTRFNFSFQDELEAREFYKHLDW